MATPADVLARRWAEREALLAEARTFAEQLDRGLGVRAVVVVGSVARGDFHHASDVDVVVVAERLPLERRARYRRLGELPPRVQPVAWTPGEWHRQRARRNPIAVEAEGAGVWLVGTPADLEGRCDAPEPATDDPGAP